MADLVGELRNSWPGLMNNHGYSYRTLPLLGGDFSADNFEPTDIEVHFAFTGQIHEQIKDPAGWDKNWQC